MNHLENSTATRRLCDNTSSRSLLWFTTLLFAVFGLLDLCFFAYFLDERAFHSNAVLIRWLPREWMFPLARGGVMGQTAFVCFSILVLPANIVVRLVGSGLCLFALAYLASFAEGALVTAWFGGLILYSLLLLGMMLPARILWFELAEFTRSVPTSGKEAPSHETNRGQSRNPLTQFSIWGLLSITTATAIAVVTAKYTDFPFDAMLRNGSIFLILATNAVLTLASILFAWRHAVLAAIMPIASLLVAILVRRFSQQGSNGLLLTDLMANFAVVAGAAVVLRIAGLRIVVRERT